MLHEIHAATGRTRPVCNRADFDGGARCIDKGAIECCAEHAAGHAGVGVGDDHKCIFRLRELGAAAASAKCARDHTGFDRDACGIDEHADGIVIVRVRLDHRVSARGEAEFVQY